MNMKNLSIRLLVVLTVLLAQVTAFAATTVSINSISIQPGQQKDVAVSIATDKADIFQIQAQLALPEGLKLVSTGSQQIQLGALTQGFIADLYNGKLLMTNFSSTPISTAQGQIFSFTVEADESLAKTSTIELTDIEVWHIGSNGVSEKVADAAANVVVADAPQGTAQFSLGATEVLLGAGNSATVAVLMSSNVALTGYQAQLQLPAGVTAKVASYSRTANAPTFNANTGMIVCFAPNGISGNEGVIFTLQLTADNSFTADADVVITNLAVTTSAAKEIYADDITLKVVAKDAASKDAADNIVLGLQEKLDNTIAYINNSYPDVANASQLTDEEQNIQNDINNLQSKVDEDYDNNVLDANEIQTLATPISEAIDALEALAAKLQGNEDGKKAIDAEISELRSKLGQAWWQAPTDLPESVDNELYGECLRISDEIDAIESETQAKYDAVELTADSKIDPERKQALLDAIDALYAELLTWQRGDVEFDLDVDMDDFYALTDSILKENLPTADRVNAFYRFDANADEAINVGDMQGIVNICLGLKANGSVFSRQSEQVKAELSVKSESTATGMRYTVSVSGMSYTGFQMDVKGAQVVSESSALTVRKSDNGSKTRILALGMEQQEGQVVTIETTGSARLENVILTQADAQTVSFDLSGTTGISAVAAGQSAEKSYNLSGREVKQARGLVISGGKKMIRK